MKNINNTIYINKPMLKKDDSIFIDENGKEWEKLLSKDYVVIGNYDKIMI